MSTKTTPAMAVNLGGISMTNPINVSAGTFGQVWQFANFYDVSVLGAITLKGASAEPWLGNSQPRMCEIASNMSVVTFGIDEDLHLPEDRVPEARFCQECGGQNKRKMGRTSATRGKDNAAAKPINSLGIRPLMRAK